MEVNHSIRYKRRSFNSFNKCLIREISPQIHVCQQGEIHMLIFRPVRASTGSACRAARLLCQRGRPYLRSNRRSLNPKIAGISKARCNLVWLPMKKVVNHSISTLSTVALLAISRAHRETSKHKHSCHNQRAFRRATFRWTQPCVNLTCSIRGSATLILPGQSQKWLFNSRDWTRASFNASFSTTRSSMVGLYGYAEAGERTCCKLSTTTATLSKTHS